MTTKEKAAEEFEPFDYGNRVDEQRDAFKEGWDAAHKAFLEGAGELWVANCYMKSVPGADDLCMFINEQPEGGFKWEFLDFKPKHAENYGQIFISQEDPRKVIGAWKEESALWRKQSAIWKDKVKELEERLKKYESKYEGRP